MAKRHHILVDPTQPSTPKQPKPAVLTNWELCILCQAEIPGESLQCPFRSTKKPIGNGYASLAEDLLQFQDLQHMPMNLQLERLDDGNGVEATLRTHSAGWHKKCRLRFNKKMFDQQRRAETSTEQHTSASQTVNTRFAHRHPKTREPICLFCDQPAGSEGLHEAATKQLDKKVRECACELQDTALLAKLAAGDMIAIEAKYHNRCLCALYNRARQASPRDNDGEEDRVHGIVFAELVVFLEDMNSDEDSAAVFRLSDLAKLYKDRLEQLGVTVDSRIHSTRLKNRLISKLPELTAHSEGRDTLLTFQKNIGPALKKACDHDSDAMHLVRAAEVVRRDMFETRFSFDGSFQADCQKDAVPPSLLALVNMIHDGSNIKHQTELAETSTTSAALAISQLLVFNSVKHARKESTGSVRHNHSRETPLPLYLSMKIHAATRSRGLVDTLHSLGMCVSYDRLLQLSSDISNGVCQRFLIEDVVCPSKLRKSLFTTAAVDNIDHNPSSATATDSFHGTGISLIQHPSHSHGGLDRGVPVLNQDRSSKSIVHMPSAYTSVPPAAPIRTRNFNVPVVQGPVRPTNFLSTAAAEKEEYRWLNLVKAAIEKQAVDNWIPWSAYHANVHHAIIPPPAINALLPLFTESAHSTAMLRHSMDITKAAVQFLNPGQVPILTADQPLFAILKEIQWTWPAAYGEDCFLIMFGGLHIEMGLLKLLGDWLEDSGWTNALVQADIASSGTADSFIRASHVTKTRHAHQVTCACLYILLDRAYQEGSMPTDTGTIPTFEEWCTQRAEESVHFNYWLKTLSLELLLLRYIRSIREANFQLYMESLTQIMPWMFALDHTHYSRWLSVHIRDMMTLGKKHPDVLREFEQGNFVVHKTTNNFSAIAIDQCHEQNNAMVKGSGGAIGLTGNPGALRRWMVAGPEISRIITEFEGQTRQPQNKEKDSGDRHHDQHPGVQAAFQKEVKTLVNVLEEMGNPFLEESQDLLVIDTRVVMDAAVADSVRKVESLGEDQYKKFVEERLESCTKPITETLPKNKLPLFSQPPVKTQSKQKELLAALKSDCGLFSRLYISCQTRHGDLDQFFSHENHAAPPALSTGGKLRIGVKADLLDCFESSQSEDRSAPVLDATVLDGAAIVQMLNCGTSKTFQEYADTVFAPYISTQLQKNWRVDLVWDVYIPDSLKGTTREKRGTGTRKRVSSSGVMPKNWKEFLRVDGNKTELFAFLSEDAVCRPQDYGKELYATRGKDVLRSPIGLDVSNLAPCSHEEADTRLILHVADAVLKGHKRVGIRTVDTDVLVLAVASFDKIKPDELWVILGTGSNLRCIAVHELVATMDPRCCSSLPIFHALTGCDTVSAFSGRGKKTAWATWKAFPEVTDAFIELECMPSKVSEKSMSLLERFVVLMYNRTSDIMEVNEARKHLFAHKGRTIENIPPTQAALKQHIKRACHQANIWNQSLISEPKLLNPSDWGWTKDTSGWKPLWTTLPEAAKSCQELIHCGCKKLCTGQCKCKKAALKCTALCWCSGDC